ncbi:MAG: glutamine-hydrolyzing GMP synthase [Planctomycetota bacterium]|nr:MAG: glutamine-hydrolyzing GMP synthase [Planctomycetota bacterium]
MHDRILVVDFGSQYTQLIARRVREHQVYSEVVAPQEALERASQGPLRGIVLSGGPASAFAQDAPRLPVEILQLDVPILGICYGMQWLCNALGGEVQPAGGEGTREFGHTRLQVESSDPLFQGVGPETVVWMSHGDRVSRLPEGFRRLAQSPGCPEAAVGDASRRLYGLQFHPEVAHTRQGSLLLENFLRDLCGCRGDWKPANVAEECIQQVRRQVGEDGEIVLGLSGGVDSSVLAVICQQAIGSRCHAIFVDTGLLRAGERELVQHTFRDHFHLDLTVVDAADRFLAQLQGVEDPEVKRKRIGHEFVEVFREQAGRFAQARYLAQGTLYPDVIESVAAHGGPTAVIKSHHNVGGLPEDLDMELVEPLRLMFKDEVRAMGRALGLPEEMVQRQPFPGPGLAVRCLGEVSKTRCETLRQADRVVREEFEVRGEHRGIWQYFAVLLNVRSVGVMGDQRTYEECCAIRAVDSQDGMTADWVYPSRDLLQTISTRIINEVPGINRVVLDLTSKPPGTIEWE